MTDDGTIQNIAYSGAVADFVVPASTTKDFIYLTLRGGDGGKATVFTSSIGRGGDGATIKASFKIGTGPGEVSEGDTLRFIIGDKGNSRNAGSQNAGTGGGGTAVLLKQADSTFWEIMMVAGGGGGGWANTVQSRDGRGGRAGESGGNGADGDESGANGGTNGDGGHATSDASGGGGAFEDGNSHFLTDGEGGGHFGWVTDSNFTVYPLGGQGGCSGTGCAAEDGYGFGGGGWSNEQAGGGGGGYSGGGGGGQAAGGGGGGSFVASFAVNNNKMDGGVTDNPEPGWARYQFFDSIAVACVSSITLNVDTENGASITPGDVDNGSSSNLNLSYAISQSDFSCADLSLSPITVTLTATDESGATATCTTSVTINDAAASLSDLTDDGNFQMVSYNGSFQDWIIPASTTKNKLQVELRGGDGGKRENPCNATGRGGEGATITTQFNIGNGADSLPPGSVVRFIVGEEGASNNGSGIEGAGGGGGTAVLYRKFGECTWTILAVAGGGGGGWADGCAFKNNGQGGRITTSGGDGKGASSGSGSGGTNGDGGKAGTFSNFEEAGGGGGAFSNGGVITCTGGNNWGDGQKGGVTGGQGGKDGSGGCGSGRNGGFGFGGGGLGDGTGGGGGGYSGGGGGGSTGGGGGGGSYVNSISDVNFPNVLNDGETTNSPNNGYIKYAMLVSTFPVAKCKKVATLSVTPESVDTLDISSIDDGSYDPDGGSLTYSINPEYSDCDNVGVHTATLTVTDVTGLTATCQTQVTVSYDISSYTELDDDGDLHILGANGSYRDFIIPENVEHSTLQLYANGGDGGEHRVNPPGPGGCTGRGGNGAEVLATFSIGCGPDQIPPGSVIRFIVGERGVSINSLGIEGAGGGGGTGIIYKAPGECDWNILIVAGGGGGGWASGACDKSDGKPGETGTSGSGGRGNSSGNGGSNGNGGTVGANWAGAGGGAATNGEEIGCGSGSNWGGGKKGAWEGGQGGQDGSGSCGSGRDGGYGFGGGGLGDASGGGGGGFSGGGSGGSSGGGGGGGSFVNPMAVSATVDGGGDTGDPEDGVAAFQFLDDQNSDVDENPVAICQNVTLDLNSTGMAMVFAKDLASLSSDFCGSNNLTYKFFNDDIGRTYTCSGAGVNTVTIVVTDIVGNTSTCTAEITVTESEAPEAVCRDVTVELDSGGNGSITAADVDDGSTDNCGITSYTLSQSSFTLSDLGTQMITMEVSDASGNTDDCIAAVSVEQDFTIEALCQNVAVNLDAGGNGSTTAAAVNNGSTASLGIASLTLDQENFTCADAGGNTVTLTVTDNNSNTATCTATVTVNDNVPPTALCQNVTIELNGSGNGSTTAAAVNNGSSDACGIQGLSLSKTSFNCADVGGNTVTLTVTDNNSNTATCTATVTVNDNVPPTALCQNVTVELNGSGNGSGNGSTTAAAVNNGSSDACGIQGFILSKTNFNCADVGSNTVTLTVTDNNSNTATCTATVTVNDNVPPTALCQNVTIELNGSGTGSTTAAAVNNSSSDACGIQGLSLSKTSFNCADVGGNTVTLTVTDNNTNTSTCTATVTVNDNVPPTALCQNVTIELNGSGTGSTTAAAVNNGSSDACGIQGFILSKTNFNCADVGGNTVTLTVTDNNGNTATCTATVTVNDNVKPLAVCQNLSVELDEQGQGSINVEQVRSSSSDACGILSEVLSRENFTCSDLGQNTVTLTITDNNSNTGACTARITVKRTIAIFDVIGSSFCTGDTDATVSLSGSETTVHYQLKQWGGGNIGSPLPGTGNALDFGMQPEGSYTVIATSNVCGNTAAMNGPAAVEVDNCAVMLPDHCGCNSPDGRTVTTLKVQALPGQNWEVKDVIGLYDIGSPAPPADPTPLAVGAMLNYIGGNMYTLDVIRLNDKGYWVLLTNGDTDLDIMVGNASW